MNAITIQPGHDGELLATLERARDLLDDGDFQAARMLASVAYDQAKAAAGAADRVRASRQLIDKARRMQADALYIETHATIRMADAVDSAQASGHLARSGRPKRSEGADHFTLDEVGLDKRRLSEARGLRNAERSDPGFIERVIEARLSEGLEPSRTGLKNAAGHAIGTKTATKGERGEDLYETPIEAVRTLLALESFTCGVIEPSVGRGAILRPFEDAGYEVTISDLVDRHIATRHGEAQQVGDFLHSRSEFKGQWDIVTNPPYGVANAYIAHAIREHQPRKMAMLLNLNFMCGFDDPDRTFVMDECPPSRVYVFTRRLPMMHRDGWDGPEASSQMNTGWFIWERNEDGSYGAGRGQWQTIRVDWLAYQHAAKLLPGAGGNVAPYRFVLPDEEDFTRQTPRKTIDERLAEHLDEAVAYATGRDWIEAGALRRELGVRPLVGVALLDALVARGMFLGPADADGRFWAPGLAPATHEVQIDVCPSPAILRDDLVDDLLSANAPVAIGVSGGKDSQAAAIATMEHLEAIGHTGPRLLVHADLGVVEWKESLPVCEDLAQRLGVELLVVRRAAGDLMERWEARWRSSIDRYISLSTVTLVPCWSTPKMRFCTSEMKTHVIRSALKKRFGASTVVNVTGVRREESAARSKCTAATQEIGAPLVTWRPIADWSVDQVFSSIASAGMRPHPAYTEYGMSRVSCRFCIMSSLADLAAAAMQDESHDLLHRMVTLECDSGFAFQGNRWLGDVAANVLGDALTSRIATAKARAEARTSLEKRITSGMLYTKGWPTRMLTDDEADILAEVRRGVCQLYGFQPLFVDRRAIHDRYAELLAKRESKAVAA